MTLDTNYNKHIIATYQILRLGLAIIAFAFPVLLWIGGKVVTLDESSTLKLQGSMSAYYHADPDDDAGNPTAGNGVMRNWFVGLLFAIGIILYLYKGVTNLENYALNIAGVLAIGIAIFPMDWPESSGTGFSAHGACAVTFFLCIAYVCIFRASDTLSLISDDKKRAYYRRRYKLIGFGMILMPAGAYALHFFLDSGWAILAVEVAGIYVFATYWWLKSHEIALSHSDESAAIGNLAVASHGISDAFRSIQVREIKK